MTKQLTIVDTVRKMEGEFKSALPEHIKSEKFTRNVITVLNSSPELLKPDVDKKSLLGSVMKAAQQGLVVDGREAALVSFFSKKEQKRIVNYIPMVSGLMKLVRNSGEVSVISTHVVKENDMFDYELGDNERMIHKPALTNRGKTIGAYSIVTLKDGEKSREWMDVDQINAIRDRKGYVNPVWKSDYDEMCRKTVFRRHSKRLPSSSDLDDVNEHDDEVDSGVTNISVNTEPEIVQEVKKESKAASAVKSRKKKESEPEVIEAEVIDIEPETGEILNEYDEEEIPV